MNKKQIKKKIDKKCKFCDESDYSTLDVHRILPGAEGGKYKDGNMVTVCANCHRKIHDGKIIILSQKYCTNGQWLFNCIIDGEEIFL